MCSISTNRTVDQELQQLERSDDRRMIEQRLFRFADEANATQMGVLDSLINSMRRMPDDLKDIRKIRIGRHRVYYTGYHTQCSYHTFYIKSFKKTGVNDEDDKRFQDKLRRALTEPKTSTLSDD